METIEKNQKGGTVIAIATMFALFFMIAFVTNFASPMGVIAKNQFNASNALSQLGNAANFVAYLFMGIPGGLILKRKGYKFTALAAVAVGFAGVGVQLVSGYASSFLVYVIGAFIAGFSMCMLNLVVNPMLNTLGGGVFALLEAAILLYLVLWLAPEFGITFFRDNASDTYLLKFFTTHTPFTLIAIIASLNGGN